LKITKRRKSNEKTKQDTEPMIYLENLINACEDIKNDIGVDKDGTPLVVDGFNYGVVSACDRIVKHFKELEDNKKRSK